MSRLVPLAHTRIPVSIHPVEDPVEDRPDSRRAGALAPAAGLSASVVTRLTRQWQDEARAFAQRRSRTGTTSTSAPTACTSTSAWRRDLRRRRSGPCDASHRCLRRAVGSEWPKAWPRSSTTSRSCSPSYDFPAKHWIHLKTTNPIESTFATVRLRTRVTTGPGSRAAGQAMAFKLIESAQDRWRAVNGAHLVALVRAGARFEKGVIVEREQQDQEAVA